MKKFGFKILSKYLETIYYSPGYGLLLQNALLGNTNSQFNLSKYYLNEMKNYVEAYAWAEVAHYRKHLGANEIKQTAAKMLDPNQITEAWNKARKYKINCTDG